MQMQQPQDIGGLSPYFQNIAQQQAMQNMAIQQGQGLTQAAGQIGKSGNDNMALAAMLRKKDPSKPAPVTDYSQPMPNYMDPAYQQAGY
jgi:uncharacterized protein (DUF3084 family)